LNPPFGHAGEDVLDAKLAAHGGFNHNRQALRIAERLETRYPDFPGLNLSREVLAGQGARANKTVARPAEGRLLEAQVVDAADAIAYDSHDADDAVALGLLSFGELETSSLWRMAAERARRRYAALDDQQFRRVAVHELIDVLVSDLVAATAARIAEAAPASAAEVLQLGKKFAGPSDAITPQQKELEQLLFARVYRHPNLLRQRAEASEALATMYDWLLAEREPLPPKFAALASEEGLPRTVADYLAGMTDRFALDEYGRIAGSGP
jgi:dGTPase